jgi:hypothetical protein
LVKEETMRSVLVAAALSAGACVTPPGPVAKAREAAQEFNLDARFGRNETTIERVALSARQSYAEHHRAWGGRVRVADIEMTGIHARSDHDVEVLVHVSWYRVDQQELLATTLRQTWHEAGGWQLLAEERVDGDIGLLGENVVFLAPPPEDRGPAQFPTVRLGDP